MSANNGVIKIGHKGKKKFAFGDDGAPFEVDVVVAFQQWISIDEGFREHSADGTILTTDIPAYHQTAVDFVRQLAIDPAAPDRVPEITTAEALEFLAKLREQYDELTDFFRPRSRERPDSPGSSAAELRFSEEGS